MILIIMLIYIKRTVAQRVSFSVPQCAIIVVPGIAYPRPSAPHIILLRKVLKKI